MRTFVGLLVLLFGWVILGLIGTGKMFTDFNFGKDAKEMETHIAQSAADSVGNTVYSVNTSVSGRDIRVSGTAANDIEKASILANLDATSGRRVVVDDLKLIDIAKPYVFEGMKSADGISFKGNAPTVATLQSYIGPATEGLVLAGGMPDTDWPKFVGLGVQGLSLLKNGAFQISDRKINLTGLVGTLEEEQDVRNIFASLPDGYQASVKLDVEPTVPYIFTGSRSESGETYSGYVPSEEARGGFTGLIGDAAQGLKPTAGLPDENWMSVVGVGIKALKGLNEGELSVMNKSVSLSGSVNTPDAVAGIQDLFAALPEGYDATFDLTSDDDGTPADLKLEWTAASGGVIDGKGPDGVAMDDLTAALKLPTLQGVFRQGKVAGKEPILQSFEGIGNALPLLESAQAHVTADTIVFDGVLLSGGDMETATSLLEDGLGPDAVINVVRSPSEPKEGDLRTNADTGKNEVYKNGFWIVVPEVVVEPKPEPVIVAPKPEPEPVVVPEPVEPKVSLLDQCVAQTTEAMSDAEINFETASATLTSDSRELVANLATILSGCVGVEGLKLEVGGHTDAQGSDEFNLKLSQERAESVRAELISSGINAQDLTAQGFGESRPIASNETEEGRAQNRRTTFTWSTN
jgi:OOP family OmpA-OmpF porin